MKDYEEVKKLMCAMLEELDEGLATITNDPQAEQAGVKDNAEQPDQRVIIQSPL